MSLIDDALKRAQAAGGGEAKPANRPWIPTPLPDPGIARRRAMARWAGIAFAIATLAAAGVWLYRREFSSGLPLPAGADQQRETLGSRQRRPEGPAVSGRGEGRPAAVPVPRPTATPDAVALATPIIVAQPLVARPPRTAAPAPPVAEAETAVKPAPAPPAPRAPQAVADGKTYAGSIALPGGAKIELGGIVWSETEPRALLNDRIAAVGAYIEGYSLTKIEENRVALEKDGVTIYISVK